MRFVLSLALAALIASPVYAQDAPADAAQPQSQSQDAMSSTSEPSQQPAAAASVLVPIDNDEAPVPSLNLMAGQVSDMNVIGSDGETIGEVSNVLGNANGEATAVTVEAGGFLGLGSKTVILMIDDLQLEMGRLATGLTQQQISELPEFQG